MDRNSAIGLTLIAVLLLGYFYWVSSQQPEQPPVQTATTQQSTPKVDSLNKATTVDSATVQQLGDLGSFATGEKAITNLETEDIKIAFSSQGGVIEELELKKYKTYSQEALKLVHPSSSKFKL